MRRLTLVLATGALLLGLLPAVATAGPDVDDDVIPGAYIVVLNAGEPGSVAAEHSRAHNASVSHVYRHALRGYAARMSAQAAARVAADPRVAYVDADRIVTTAHHLCGHDKPVPGPCDDSPPPTTTTYTVSGTVTKSGTTTAIGGATVTIQNTEHTATTDADGRYTISGVATGDYTMKATATGYDDATQNVTVDGDEVVDFALSTSTTETSQTTPWGIARVGAPLANTGAGINVYVIDSGIDPRHRDLNVLGGYAVETCKGGGCAAAWDDDHGHGTHVAGSVGAKNNDVDVVGVAPGVNLYAVKVLSKSGSGTRAGVIAGIDWVAGHNPGVARVANMSLGGSGSKTGTCTSSGFTGTDSYHQAICNATLAGVVFAVAAGNSGANAAGAVPAAYDDTVITVSATSASNDWATWSNWGTGTANGIPTASAPVGIAAPGVSILSTRAGGGTTTMSGTSMAAPHVAGAIALYLVAAPQSAGYGAFSNARADLLGPRAEVTWNGAYVNGWKNTTGNPHVERFLQVTGL